MYSFCCFVIVLLRILLINCMYSSHHSDHYISSDLLAHQQILKESTLSGSDLSSSLCLAWRLVGDSESICNLLNMLVQSFESKNRRWSEINSSWSMLINCETEYASYICFMSIVSKLLLSCTFIFAIDIFSLIGFFFVSENYFRSLGFYLTTAQNKFILLVHRFWFHLPKI